MLPLVVCALFGSCCSFFFALQAFSAAAAASFLFCYTLLFSTFSGFFFFASFVCLFRGFSFATRSCSALATAASLTLAFFLTLTAAASFWRDQLLLSRLSFVLSLNEPLQLYVVSLFQLGVFQLLASLSLLWLVFFQLADVFFFRFTILFQVARFRDVTCLTVLVLSLTRSFSLLTNLLEKLLAN